MNNPNAPTTIQREPIKVLADIIQYELELPASQVMLEFQKADIPDTPGLYVVLSYVGPSKVIANVNEHFNNGTGPNFSMTEIQTLTMLHTIQVDLMSFDSSARLRKEEVAMSLRSLKAQYDMEAANMSIARMPGPFIDAHSLEGTAILNRFTTSVNITAVHRKTKVVGNYYDTFKVAVTEGGPLGVPFNPEQPS